VSSWPKLPLPRSSTRFKLEQAEIASDPQHELAATEQDLRGRRHELISAAAERNVVVAAMGTSPSTLFPTATPDERYRRMQQQYGLVAADQLTCGTHVHVAVQSRAEGVAAIDGARRWIGVRLSAKYPTVEFRMADVGQEVEPSWVRRCGPTATTRSCTG
jgi:glutamate---cysteine ligase / carboxylate-amine ligase